MSNTSTLELHQLQPIEPPPSAVSPQNVRRISIQTTHSHRLQSKPAGGEQEDVPDSLPSPVPVNAVDAKQRWNHPRSNMFRVFAAFWSFILMGMNDGAYGALIPYLEKYYDLSYTVISLIFLSPFGGYIFAALLNNAIHTRFGQRGVAIIGPACRVVSYTIASNHPPYPLLVISFVITGFGIGVPDAAWNAWIGDMANENQMLGFLHGFYGLGATLGPLLATSFIVRAGWPWYSFYYLMVAGVVLELITSTAAFWHRNGAAFRASIAEPSSENTTGANSSSNSNSNSRLKQALFTRPAARVTWLCSVFLLGYVGIEVALGGWLVTFMLRVRDGDPFASGMTATGFWLGLTVGRVILGFVTARIGEKLAICIYLPLSMALELLFWLVPSFLLSAIFVALQGFFLGPLFPAAIVAATKLLPKHLHVAAIGFAAAFGGTGAAVFPFAVGALAQSRGVWVLQPVILAMLAATLGVWLCLPRIGKKRD